MPEIQYAQLKQYLAKIAIAGDENSLAPVHLIYGEELLSRKAFKAILDRLLPEEERGLHYEPIAGDQETVTETIEKLNTYALLPGKRVVAVLDSKIFYSRTNALTILDKAREANGRKDEKKAVQHTLDLLGLLKLDYETIDGQNLPRSLGLDPDEIVDVDWLIKLIERCRMQRLPIPDRRDRGDLLKAAIEKGFPRHHYLLMTTDVVDRRQRLFKTIVKTGVVINCAVPKGDRRADRAVQDGVLAGQMKEILDRGQKKIKPDAYRALVEMTGFDLPTFASNLEKLISYLGDRETITVEDVEMVLRRTKQDPIYELTNAIVERDIRASLFFLRSLLNDQMHPLQILAAITNQIRKLLVVKDFVMDESGKAWYKGLSFDRFKRQVMPAVESYDQLILQRLASWDADSSGEAESRKGKSKKIKTDLLMAKNPKNPYPVFLALQRSDAYKAEELIEAVCRLAEADRRLKSSPQDPCLILEHTILSICRKTNGVSGKPNTTTVRNHARTSRSSDSR